MNLYEKNSLGVLDLKMDYSGWLYKNIIILKRNGKEIAQ
jgi:hypothetical protein